MKWKIANNSQRNFCGQRWRLSTLLYFLSLSERTLGENKKILNKTNIENFVTLKHIVLVYKIFDKDYFDFNYFFLTILGFSIYTF